MRHLNQLQFRQENFLIGSKTTEHSLLSHATRLSAHLTIGII